MKRNQVLAIIGTLSIAAAFLIFGSQSSDLNKAKNVANQFYTYLEEEDYQSVLSLYHEDFLNKTNLEETTAFFETLNSKLGDTTNRKLVQRYSESINTEAGNAIQITLVYEVTREEHNSKETIKILKEGNGSYLIYAYSINSVGLQ